MAVLLFLAAVTYAAHGSSTPPGNECSRPLLHDGHFLLSSLLKMAGYSDVCVAAALDSCSSPQENSPFASIMEEARAMVREVKHAVNTWKSPPRHCKDILDSGDNVSGVRQIYPFLDRPYFRVNAYCEQTIDGGGWTVVQRRSNDSIRQRFYRTLNEYKLGFGDKEGEFWFGLVPIYELTRTTVHELRIDLEDYDGARGFAKYGYFHLRSLSSFQLTAERYTGNVGDALIEHNGQPFSTYDSDRDRSTMNCAEVSYGGWWYHDCYDSNLNGLQHNSASTSVDGIRWNTWDGRGSLRRTTMMIRPAF